jgi:hypothetical protein
MFGRQHATMIVRIATPAIAVLTNRKMKTTNNTQPFGAAFLLSRQSACPTETIVGAQALHHDGSTQYDDDFEQRPRRERRSKKLIPPFHFNADAPI